jgi:hypothetical protein
MINKIGLVLHRMFCHFQGGSRHLHVSGVTCRLLVVWTWNGLGVAPLHRLCMFCHFQGGSRQFLISMIDLVLHRITIVRMFLPVSGWVTSP